MYSFQQQAFLFVIKHFVWILKFQIWSSVIGIRYWLQSSTEYPTKSCRTMLSTLGEANEHCAACCCFWNCLAFQSVVTVGLRHMWKFWWWHLTLLPVYLLLLSLSLLQESLQLRGAEHRTASSLTSRQQTKHLFPQSPVTFDGIWKLEMGVENRKA